MLLGKKRGAGIQAGAPVVPGIGPVRRQRQDQDVPVSPIGDHRLACLRPRRRIVHRLRADPTAPQARSGITASGASTRPTATTHRTHCRAVGAAQRCTPNPNASASNNARPPRYRVPSRNKATPGTLSAIVASSPALTTPASPSTTDWPRPRATAVDDLTSEHLDHRPNSRGDRARPTAHSQSTGTQLDPLSGTVSAFQMPPSPSTLKNAPRCPSPDAANARTAAAPHRRCLDAAARRRSMAD